MIDPYKNDMPASDSDGLRRVCADHKYAYFCFSHLNTGAVVSGFCNVVPLPGTFYKESWAFLISKISPYKGLINCSWDNEIKSLDTWLTVHYYCEFLGSCPIQKDMFTYNLETIDLTWVRYDSFVPFRKFIRLAWYNLKLVIKNFV